MPWWGICALLGWLTMAILDHLFHHPAGWEGYLLQAVYFVPGIALSWFAAVRINQRLAWCVKWFNKGFDSPTKGYGRLISGFLRVSVIVLLVYGGLLVLTFLGLTHTDRLRAISGQGFTLS
ncbi:MAG: hypothetical protein U0792_09020 [Gemmataceae bacterium]